MNDPDNTGAGPESFRRPPVPPGLTIRDACPEDNDALIVLERESPLLLGPAELTFDRSPDFFASGRLQAEHRIAVGEMDGRIVGVVAAAIHSPQLQGQRRRLAYIHHGRIHPSAQRRGVGAALAGWLVDWAREQGAEGPYWLIAPENQRSMAFGSRIGGRWPRDVVFREYDLSNLGDASPAEGNAGATARPRRLPPERLPEVPALVNLTHRREDLFEPLTAESLAARLSRDPDQYDGRRLYGIVEDWKLVAVAGLWDSGASSEAIRRDGVTGAVRRTRSVAVLDWGYAPGRRDAFAVLLRSLAAEARALGRNALTISEPAPEVLPDIGLPSRVWTVALFTPTVPPPPLESVRGIFADMVYV